MTTRTKTYPIVENAINLFGDWLKHRQEMRELRDMNSGDFARIARDLCVSPAELDAVIRQGPHGAAQHVSHPVRILAVGVKRVALITFDWPALTTFAGLLKASLFDDALLGLRKPKDQEIVRQAREAAARMLILLEARQF